MATFLIATLALASVSEEDAALAYLCAILILAEPYRLRDDGKFVRGKLRKIYDDFMNEKTILSKDRKTGIDIWISYIAFIFGLEFKCSYELIKEKDYINKLFDRFEYKLENKKMNELRTKALNYLDMKIR